MKTNKTRSLATLIVVFAIAALTSCQDTAMEEIEREINRNPDREINGGTNSGNENNDNTGNDNGNKNGNDNGGQTGNDSNSDGNTGTDDDSNDGNSGNNGNANTGGDNSGSNNDKESDENKGETGCDIRIDSSELPRHMATYITTNYSQKPPYYYIAKVTVCKENGVIQSYTVELSGPNSITLQFDKDGYPAN